MHKLEVSLSPELLPTSSLSESIVIVVDIFRATSCMVTGLAHGIPHIVPVAAEETALEYRPQRYTLAGERDGQKIPGFDIGNSPREYIEAATKGQRVCSTTTNGTKAIEKAKSAKKILMGAFLNLDTTASYLRNANMPVHIVCAGWKGQPCVEDSMYAGVLASMLQDHLLPANDSALMVTQWYQSNRNNWKNLLLQGSHTHRLRGLGIKEDLEYCLEWNKFDIIAIMDLEKWQLKAENT